MRHAKRGLTALTVIVAVVASLALTSTATAETVSSNVALYQTVTVTNGTLDTTNYGPASNMTDDLNGGTTSQVWFTSTTSGLQIDLGGLYDLESLYLGFKDVTYAKGAKIKAYAADGTTQVGTTYTVPSTSGTTTYTPTLSDWLDVQYVRITDEGSSPATMRLREFRAFSQVETYGSFITGVTATASETYPGVADVYANALCNSAGMNDQRGPVGDPSAMSITSGPFWQSNSNVTDASVTFNLGEVRDDLDKMLIWNLNQTNWATRGIQHATIEYSTDGTNFIEMADVNGTEGGNYTIPMVTPNVQNGYSLSVSLSGLEAQYVRIHGLDSWGGTNIGLSEVRFYEIPEPSTALMLLMGLGILGLVRRR